MVVKNHTVLTSEEVYKSLLAAARKSYLGRFIFASALAVFGIIIVIVVASSGNATDTLVTGLMFLIFALIFALINTISFIRLPKKVAKRNSDVIEGGMINDFVFKEESFSLSSKIAGKVSKFEGKYNELNKIVEEDKQILFVLGQTETIVCKKSGFASPKEMNLFFYGLSKHKTKIKNKLDKTKD